MLDYRQFPMPIRHKQLIYLKMKKKILIIEDDAFLGNVLNEKLQKAGYATSLVTDGEEGLKQIGMQKPDLILLDIMLPKKNGYEILEAKRQDSSIAAIPVIIISNSGQPVEINRALALGSVDYLVKADLDPDEVLEKVLIRLGGPEEAPATPTGSLEGKKVLWVEDDSFLGDILAAKLTSEKCSLLYAKDGETALKLLETNTPDIVLLDLVLPGISGFEVLEHIKQDDRTKNVPVIILSNLAQESDLERITKLGATKHFIKASIDPASVIKEIISTLA
jgi:CheY-like chemotaxis protein